MDQEARNSQNIARTGLLTLFTARVHEAAETSSEKPITASVCLLTSFTGDPTSWCGHVHRTKWGLDIQVGQIRHTNWWGEILNSLQQVVEPRTATPTAPLAGSVLLLTAPTFLLKKKTLCNSLFGQSRVRFADKRGSSAHVFVAVVEHGEELLQVLRIPRVRVRSEESDHRLVVRPPQLHVPLQLGRGQAVCNRL